jgi:hypothetical protein
MPSSFVFTFVNTSFVCIILFVQTVVDWDGKTQKHYRNELCIPDRSDDINDFFGLWKMRFHANDKRAVDQTEMKPVY